MYAANNEVHEFNMVFDIIIHKYHNVCESNGWKNT